MSDKKSIPINTPQPTKPESGKNSLPAFQNPPPPPPPPPPKGKSGSK